jgi:hypothetical protein
VTSSDAQELEGNAALDFAGQHLTKVRVDLVKWEIEYFDPKTLGTWMMDYPNGELQGGGSPRLRKVSHSAAYRIDRNLHTELWTSFASQIRSYGTAHGLNSKHQAVVEVSSDLILLRVGTKWLQFTPSEMTYDTGHTHPFHLNEDGTVTAGDITEEMDFTAERLTRELMQ